MTTDATATKQSSEDSLKRTQTGSRVGVKRKIKTDNTTTTFTCTLTLTPTLMPSSRNVSQRLMLEFVTTTQANKQNSTNVHMHIHIQHNATTIRTLNAIARRTTEELHTYIRTTTAKQGNYNCNSFRNALKTDVATATGYVATRLAQKAQ